MRLLANDPAARPSMPAAVRALAAVATHEPTRVTSAPKPASAAPARAARRSRSRSLRWLRPAVLFGTAGCLLALAVVLTVTSTTALPRASVLPAPARQVQPAEAQPAEAQPAEAQPAEAQPAQLEQTARTYYGLLPDDTTVAWQYLGAAERAQGFQHYNDFWSGINRISIRGPVAVEGNTVLVNLVFEPTNRKRTFERYRLAMGTAPDGRVLIESATKSS